MGRWLTYGSCSLHEPTKRTYCGCHQKKVRSIHMTWHVLTVLNTVWSCFVFMLGSFELTGGALLSYYSSMCQDSVRIRNVSNHTRQRVFADAASERCHLRRSIFHIILYNRVSQIDQKSLVFLFYHWLRYVRGANKINFSIDPWTKLCHPFYIIITLGKSGKNEIWP